jgi:kynurenine 3-monooxygenase
MESRKVAILGAGPAGMTLAVLLAKKGYNIEIFEKRFDPLSGNQNTDGRSFNLGLTVRGIKGFKEMGLDQEILGQTVPVKEVCVHQPNGDQVIIPMGGY